MKARYRFHKYQVGDSQGQLFDNNVATKSLSGPDRLKNQCGSYYLNESLSMFGLQEAKFDETENYFAQILRCISKKKLNVENELEMQWTLFVLTLSNFISSNNDYERFLSIKRNSSSLVLIETFVKSCEDIRIKNTFTQQLISAILQLLCKDDNFNKGLVETNTVIAKSSVFIGLLRFHLMLPSSPLDPSEEILYKINANNSRMEKIKQEITVIVAHRKIWNGCDVNNIDKIEELKILHLELVSLKEKTLELKKNIVHRPGGKQAFASLYRELYNGANTVFGETKIMQIINSIEENTVHKHSIEETWQSSTCQFIHGVTKSYYGYEDVITPILSCVYQIKQGVRLLLLNSKTRASKLSENMELNALFNNFLALPSSRNLSSYKSILDSLPDKIKILVLHAVLNYQMIARFKENSPMF